MKQLFSREYQKSHLLNPAREYVPAVQTDVAATFARIIAQQQKGAQKKVRRIK